MNHYIRCIALILFALFLSNSVLFARSEKAEQKSKNVQLLVSKIIQDGTYFTFIYDKQNRLIEKNEVDTRLNAYYKEVIGYDINGRVIKIITELAENNEVVEVSSYKYEYQSNTVIESKADGHILDREVEITLNHDRKIANYNGTVFTYDKRGNLICCYRKDQMVNDKNQEQIDVSKTDYIKYDNMQSPFAHVKTEMWVIQRMTNITEYIGENNCLKVVDKTLRYINGDKDNKNSQTKDENIKYNYNGYGYPITATKKGLNNKSIVTQFEYKEVDNMQW